MSKDYAQIDDLDCVLTVDDGLEGDEKSKDGPPNFVGHVSFRNDAPNFRGEIYKSCDTCNNLDFANSWCGKHEFDPNYELKGLPATHTVCDDWE